MLLGKQIHDEARKRVGHIEEIHARREGKDWVIEEYKVGALAFLERFAALTIFDGVTRKLIRGKHLGYVIPWDKLDLTDPERPRLLGRKEELTPIEPDVEEEKERALRQP